MFVVLEHNGRYVACYPEGDMRVFCCRSLADSYAAKLSADNDGVFYVATIGNPTLDSFRRARSEYRNGFLRFNY